MLRELLEFPVLRLAERVRHWVRQTIAEAVVGGAAEGVADGLARLDSGVPSIANSGAPALDTSIKDPSPVSAAGNVPPMARPALPFPDTSTAAPPPKRGRGRPRKFLRHDHETDRS